MKKVLLFIVIIGLALWFFVFRNKDASPDAGNENNEQVTQQEDPLKEFRESERNNFDKGSYTASSESFVAITDVQGEPIGTYSKVTGKAEVTDGGEISGFNVAFKGNNYTGEADNVLAGKDISFEALSVLPNTVDDAFTVALSVKIGEATGSVAVGMNIEKRAKSFYLSGPVTLNRQSFGLPGEGSLFLDFDVLFD